MANLTGIKGDKWVKFSFTLSHNNNNNDNNNNNINNNNNNNNNNNKTIIIAMIIRFYNTKTQSSRLNLFHISLDQSSI